MKVKFISARRHENLKKTCPTRESSATSRGRPKAPMRSLGLVGEANAFDYDYKGLLCSSAWREDRCAGAGMKISI